MNLKDKLHFLLDKASLYGTEMILTSSYDKRLSKIVYGLTFELEILDEEGDRNNEDLYSYGTDIEEIIDEVIKQYNQKFNRLP